MANSYSDPLRPARPGRINAQVHPTPTYHGESLVPDYSKWMPGLADYDRLQRNRAMGVPVGQYDPAFPPVPQPAPALSAPSSVPSAIGDGAHRFFLGRQAPLFTTPASSLTDPPPIFTTDPVTPRYQRPEPAPVATDPVIVPKKKGPGPVYFGAQTPVFTTPPEGLCNQPPIFTGGPVMPLPPKPIHKSRSPYADDRPAFGTQPITVNPGALGGWTYADVGSGKDWPQDEASRGLILPPAPGSSIYKPFASAPKPESEGAFPSLLGPAGSSLDTPEQHESYTPNPEAVKRAYAFIAGHAIDADGDPNAYGGPNKEGLDNKENAKKNLKRNGKVVNDQDGHPVRVWSRDVIIHDPKTGQPYIQKSNEASPGSYVTATTLADSFYPRETDIRRYADSSKIPYVVRDKAMRQANVQFGDIVTVYNIENGKFVHAIVGDAGPDETLGEISMNASARLGLSTDPKNGGTKNEQLVIIPYRGSSGVDNALSKNVIKYGSHIPSDDVIQAKGDAYFKAAGQNILNNILKGRHKK